MKIYSFKILKQTYSQFLDASQCICKLKCYKDKTQNA